MDMWTPSRAQYNPTSIIPPTNPASSDTESYLASAPPLFTGIRQGYVSLNIPRATSPSAALVLALKAMQKEKKVLLEQMATLSEENEKRVSAMEGQIAAAAKDKKDLESQMEHIRRQLKAGMTDISVQVENADQGGSSTAVVCERIIRIIQRQKEGFEGKLRASQERLEHRTTVYNRLVKELEVIRPTFDLLVQDKAASKKTIRDLKNRIISDTDKNGMKMAGLENQISELQMSLLNLKREDGVRTSSLQTALGHSRMVIQQTNEESAERLRKYRQSLSGRRNENDASVEKLRSKLTNLQLTNDRLQRELTATRMQKEDIENEMNALKHAQVGSRTDFQRTLSELHERIASQHHQLVQESAFRTKAQHKLYRMEEFLDDLLRETKLSSKKKSRKTPTKKRPPTPRMTVSAMLKARHSTPTKTKTSASKTQKLKLRKKHSRSVRSLRSMVATLSEGLLNLDKRHEQIRLKEDPSPPHIHNFKDGVRVI